VRSRARVRGRPGPLDQAEDLYGDWKMIGMVHRGTAQNPAYVKGSTIRIEAGKRLLQCSDGSLGGFFRPLLCRRYNFAVHVNEWAAGGCVHVDRRKNGGDTR
jgi:hypothetical protein